MMSLSWSRPSLRIVAAIVFLTMATVAPAAAVEAPPLDPTSSIGPSDAGVPQGAGTAAAAADQGSGQLNGTFKLKAGACSAAVSGSYFRMIQPGGTATGPFVQNSDSPCADKTYTSLSPGKDGGLVTGTHQAEPNPAFDGTGGGLADRITAPQKFYGVSFATATNATDPQTATKTTAPTIARDSAGHLTGDLRAFAASWNNQHFNQGAPKPDGTSPGITGGPTGTLDSSTGAFVLEWTSQIVGGAFNNFTGQWHLEGTFAASGGATSASATTTGSPTTAQGDSTVSAASTARAAAASSVARTSPLASTGLAVSPALGVALILLGLVLVLMAGADFGGTHRPVNGPPDE